MKRRSGDGLLNTSTKEILNTPEYQRCVIYRIDLRAGQGKRKLEESVQIAQTIHGKNWKEYLSRKTLMDDVSRYSGSKEIILICTLEMS
jgi:hypothetical protein